MSESKQPVYLSMKIIALTGVFALLGLFYYLSEQSAKPDLRPAVLKTGDLVSAQVLNTLGANKQFTYLNLWAEWCEPCKEELRIFESWASEMKLNNIRVVLVNIDTDEIPKERAKRLQKSLAPSVAALYKPYSAFLTNMAIPILPMHLIIDPEGTIVRDLYGSIVGKSDEIKEFLLKANREWVPSANP